MKPPEENNTNPRWTYEDLANTMTITPFQVVTKDGNTHSENWNKYVALCMAKYIYANSPSEDDVFFMAVMLRNRYIKCQNRFLSSNSSYVNPYWQCTPFSMDRLVKAKGDCVWLLPEWRFTFLEVSQADRAQANEYFNSCLDAAILIVEEKENAYSSFLNFTHCDFVFKKDIKEVYGMNVPKEYYNKRLFDTKGKHGVVETEHTIFYDAYPDIPLVYRGVTTK